MQKALTFFLTRRPLFTSSLAKKKEQPCKAPYFADNTASFFMSLVRYDTLMTLQNLRVRQLFKSLTQSRIRRTCLSQKNHSYDVTKKRLILIQICQFLQLNLELIQEFGMTPPSVDFLNTIDYKVYFGSQYEFGTSPDSNDNQKSTRK